VQAQAQAQAQEVEGTPPAAPWLRRNLVVSALGVPARGLHLVALLAISHRLGAATLGHFLLGMGLFEIAVAVVATGFTDGTLLFVSRASAGTTPSRPGSAGSRATGLTREVRGARTPPPAAEAARSAAITSVVDVLASALGAGGLAAMLLACVATAAVIAAGPAAPLALTVVSGGAPVAQHLRAAPHAEVLSGALFLAWAVLPALVSRVAFAGTSAFLRLEWEALLGTAGPPLGLLLALPLIHLHGGAGGPAEAARALFAAMGVVQLGMAVLGLAVLHRHLPRTVSLRAATWAVLRHPRRRLHRGLARFAVPQALNMAATTYIGRLDLLVLSASGAPAAAVGAYGAVAALVLELRQLRTVVSAALGGLVSRQHALGARAAIARTLSRSSAWIAALAVPVALGFAVVRRDVVALVLAPDQARAGEGSDPRRLVPLILLIGPLVNCIGGLAGNFMVYLLHNRWNLLNATAVAILDTALAWLLVPRLGLTGAAIAGTVGIALLTVLENLELALLEGIAIEPRVLVAVATTLAAGALAVFTIEPAAAQAGPLMRAGLAVGVALLAGALASRGIRAAGRPPRAAGSLAQTGAVR
jgi:O-antigen/teichoic acid export membrane protein